MHYTCMRQNVAYKYYSALVRRSKLYKSNTNNQKSKTKQKLKTKTKQKTTKAKTKTKRKRKTKTKNKTKQNKKQKTKNKKKTKQKQKKNSSSIFHNFSNSTRFSYLTWFLSFLASMGFHDQQNSWLVTLFLSLSAIPYTLYTLCSQYG